MAESRLTAIATCEGEYMTTIGAARPVIGPGLRRLIELAISSRLEPTVDKAVRRWVT